jgi:hypothetical protein
LITAAAPAAFEPFSLFRGRGGRDHLSAQQSRELQRENRDAAGPLGQHRVSGGYAAMAGQRHPGGHGGARQGRSLLKREIAGHRDCRFLVDHRVFREHAVEVGAKPVG